MGAKSFHPHRCRCSCRKASRLRRFTHTELELIDRMIKDAVAASLGADAREAALWMSCYETPASPGKRQARINRAASTRAALAIVNQPRRNAGG